MDIRVDISVPNPSSVLLSYDRIQIFRSDNGKRGEFYDISTSPPPDQRDNTIELDPKISSYVYRDEDGDADSWYKARFFNSGTMAVSAFSDPIMGDGDSALDVISVEDFKLLYLWGVDLTKDDGEEYPDSFHEFYIKSAVSYLEHRLNLRIRPKTIVEKLDHYPLDNGFFKLSEKPVVEIEKFVVRDSGTEINVDDICLERESGQINLQAGVNFAFYNQFRAQAYEVTYRAGFPRNEIPDNIKELVGKIASYGPLNVAGDLVGGAGLAATSLSIDGLSQSVTTTNSSTNAGFGARIIMYRKEVNDQLKIMSAFYNGPRLAVI